MTYTFGDNDTAARRLHLLAEVYRPSSLEFLRRWAPVDPAVAVDLGSGPGLTSRLVSDATGAVRTVGLDASPAYVDAASGSAPAGVSFVCHDVTCAPLPVPAADLLYCRFLLTHLTDPVAALAGWRSAACPRGRLLVEEMDRLRSPDPVLARYYELVALLQDHHGQTMSIGGVLDAAVPAAGWSLLRSEVVDLHPAPEEMAALHLWNLATWRNDEFVRATCTEAELDDLAEGLHAVARGERSAEIDHGMRWIVAAP